MRSLYLSAGLVLLYTVCVHSIMWHLEPNTRKCLREELGQNVLIAGEYEVSELPGQRVDYQVSMLTRDK
ncbi:transmembrane emp24 domain-containing protein bai-like [Diaphorina citri]|uniref:Transmembrane emp24 domain-containing protein bai-like n=1 Tax=Diaphorina citri TaxID=121845 RepID=A0A3Q0IW66_DIACI|nr:transmembrane emp24 domain-containing protein bai-like [Diaphorina citri]